MEKTRSEDGSGTEVVYVASSITNDPPAASPVIVTFEMPLAKLTERNSFGLLPGSPNSASLLENAEVATATSVLAAAKPARVNGSA